jgi:hypothetical protein
MRATQNKDLPPTPQGSYTDPGAPLSISTSDPRSADGLSQSLEVRSAPPPPSPQRMVSGPAASPSPSKRDKAWKAGAPKPHGQGDKNLRFASGSKSRTSPKDGEKIKRRHSHEPKVNVYTECGRHSDEWLFGPLADSVKRLLDRDKDSPKERS